MDLTWKEKKHEQHAAHNTFTNLASFVLEPFPSKFSISLRSSLFELDFKNNDCSITVKFSFLVLGFIVKLQVREKCLEIVFHEKRGNRIKTTWWSCWKRLLRELSWSFCIFTPFGTQSLQSKGKITGQLCLFLCSPGLNLMFALTWEWEDNGNIFILKWSLMVWWSIKRRHTLLAPLSACRVVDNRSLALSASIFPAVHPVRVQRLRIGQPDLRPGEASVCLRRSDGEVQLQGMAHTHKKTNTWILAFVFLSCI